jgi:hypothetical protein
VPVISPEERPASEGMGSWTHQKDYEAPAPAVAPKQPSALEAALDDFHFYARRASEYEATPYIIVAVLFVALAAALALRRRLRRPS